MKMPSLLSTKLLWSVRKQVKANIMYKSKDQGWPQEFS